MLMFKDFGLQFLLVVELNSLHRMVLTMFFFSKYLLRIFFLLKKPPKYFSVSVFENSLVLKRTV